VVGAVDDRDRTAPEPLAREQPVAEPEVDRAPPDRPSLEPLDGALDGVGLSEAVEPLAVDRGAVPDVRLAVELGGRLDGADDRQVVRHGEVPVALVLARDGHDRARAVAQQHVVGEVDRHGLVVEGVDRVAAGEHAALLEWAFVRETVELARLADLGHEGLDLGAAVVGGERWHELVLGREHDVGHAKARVGARREHGDDGVRHALYRDLELGALGPADPIALHRLHAVGPVERVEVVEELVGVLGDLEEPLLEVALGDHVAAALARPVRQDLLVGQNRLAARAPVDRRVLAVREAGLEEAQEDPLRPADVLRVVALEHPAPVVGRADPLERGRQLFDARVCERPRVLTGLDRRVLGRQAERVEPDR
jgi:hypothetical protein